jgi:hypothetical protein
MPFLLPFFMRAWRRARRGFRQPMPGGTRCGKASRAVGQSGATVIEFPIVAVPLLLAGLGSIEVAHWLLTRQALSLALLQAARAGATDHGRPDTIEAAFEHALLPLFPGKERRSAMQARSDAFARRGHDTGLAPWQIQILSPTAAAFDDFVDPTVMRAEHSGAMLHEQDGRRQTQHPALPVTPGLPAINNHYQLEQHRRHAAAGWPGGRGPRSGQSIFEANTLVLRLRYLHEPALPGIKGLLRLLGNERGTYGQRAMALGGYLPLTREIALTMESHPVLWPLPANGKLIRAPESPAAAAPDIASCHGWWCARQAPPARPFDGSVPDQPASGTPAPGLPASGNPADTTGPGDVAAGRPPGGHSNSGEDPDVIHDALGVAPDDPACGVVLCCVAG